MKVVLLVVGKTDMKYCIDALDDYQGRIKHYLRFDTKVISDIKKTGSMTESQQKELEGQQICKFLEPGDWCILLDERGKEYTSVQFAAYLEKRLQAAVKRLVFVIGGPFGFSDEVYTNAGEQIALSKMTFSHQMVRMIFLEQVYRAVTILRNEQYHH